jgi:CheY-like chemotaxis protein
MRRCRTGPSSRATIRQRAREAGFDHHLVKPPDTELLLRLLAEVTPAEQAVPPTP